MKWTGGAGEFSIEDLVQNILERQRAKPQPRTHTCLCNTVQGESPARRRGDAPSADPRVSPVSPGVNIPHRCNNTKHRIISPKLPASACTPPPAEAGEAVGGDATLPHLQAQTSPDPSPLPPA